MNAPLHVLRSLGEADLRATLAFVAEIDEARDVATLAAIQPYLEAAHATAAAFDRVREDVDLLIRGIDAADVPLILLDGASRIVAMTARARSILQRHLSWHGGGRVPHALGECILGRRSGSTAAHGRGPCTPVVIEREDAQIEIRMVEDAGRAVLLLEERPRHAQGGAPNGFGLTSREVDVLSRIAEGLTNKEAAAALAVSPSTIKTHLDHIYRKLCVTTRTAAVARAVRAKSERRDISN